MIRQDKFVLVLQTGNCALYHCLDLGKSCISLGRCDTHQCRLLTDLCKCAQGIAWVNGFNLGWYWPAKGPQMTLYLPGPLLQRGVNEIVLLEMDRAPRQPSGTALCTYRTKPLYETLIECAVNFIGGRTHCQAQSQIIHVSHACYALLLAVASCDEIGTMPLNRALFIVPCGPSHSIPSFLNLITIMRTIRCTLLDPGTCTDNLHV